jgi:hypothetical protein
MDQSFNTKKSTAPFFLCACTERALDTTIDAREVPIATLMSSPDSSVKKGKTANSAGTTTNPPPFPNNPDVMPAIAPAKHNVATNHNSSTSITPLSHILVVGNTEESAVHKVQSRINANINKRLFISHVGQTLA